MRILLSIIGTVLLLPIALTLVVLVCITMVGGYVAIVLQVAWWLVLAILAIVLAIRLIKRFT